MTIDFRPDAQVQGENSIGKAGIVVHSPASLFEPYRVHIRYGLFDSIVKAAQQTWTMTILTFKFIGHMITGSVSLSNISGPVTIAEVAGVSFLLGIVSYSECAGDNQHQYRRTQFTSCAGIGRRSFIALLMGIYRRQATVHSGASQSPVGRYGNDRFFDSAGFVQRSTTSVGFLIKGGYY